MPISFCIVYVFHFAVNDKEFSQLPALQTAWLDMQQKLLTFERVSSLTRDIAEFTCQTIPDTLGVDSPCWIAAIVIISVAEIVLTGLGIAYEGEQQLGIPLFSYTFHITHNQRSSIPSLEPQI